MKGRQRFGFALRGRFHLKSIGWMIDVGNDKLAFLIFNRCHLKLKPLTSNDLDLNKPNKSQTQFEYTNTFKSYIARKALFNYEKVV